MEVIEMDQHADMPLEEKAVGLGVKSIRICQVKFSVGVKVLCARRLSPQATHLKARR